MSIQVQDAGASRAGRKRKPISEAEAERRARQSEQDREHHPDRVLSFRQWCELNGFSPATGERIIKRGEIPVLQLSVAFDRTLAHASKPRSLLLRRHVGKFAYLALPVRQRCHARGHHCALRRIEVTTGEVLREDVCGRVLAVIEHDVAGLDPGGAAGTLSIAPVFRRLGL
jgi:hypothetical protein